MDLSDSDDDDNNNMPVGMEMAVEKAIASYALADAAEEFVKDLKEFGGSDRIRLTFAGELQEIIQRMPTSALEGLNSLFLHRACYN